ncbi:MAG TPA: biotin carboxylase N-terminal domain-containing protein [Actinomycetes bacterium]|jgi:acetyl-CoA/propionyl-CoA carboxylase biotin carboxyl carrier protein|nr:biotin carboxylase N-terminal domain-containing protein [Actinomycetes bacterium]
MTIGRRFGTVLVANRGEIAVRVLRACREQGLVGVAVYAEPDARALHVREADRAVALGGARVTESYLDAGKLLAAALRAGAEAVHPGYGLLSENADFARAVEAAGLVWVGPPADAIAQMGDKLAARRTVLAAGVEPVPGTTAPVREAAEVVAFGQAHGWPVAVKAAAGGGGRGIRVVRGPDEAAAALAAAAREAAATFGSAVCYLERFFERPRHVEVQVLADAHGGIVHLGERDCSVQRRHQKLVEESPSPGLPAEVRERITTWAVAVAKACGYVGAGTVELLWDPASGGAWFLEMNTRLQVEHPVTEAVTGVDIVAAQLRIAAGEPLGFGQEEVRFAGHAVECRINAEDPGRHFLPTSGPVTRLRWPGGPGVRVDAGYQSGDTVSPFYDDLLGKVITWGRDREAAIERMGAALADLEVCGVAATTAALARILDHEDFRAGAHWTTWLEEVVDLADLARPEAVAGDGDGGPDFTVTVQGATYPVRLYRHRPSRLTGRTGMGSRVASPLTGTLSRVEVSPGDRVDAGDLLAVVEAMKMETPLRAPSAGKVVEVPPAVGGPVSAGQTVVVLDTGERGAGSG